MRAQWKTACLKTRAQIELSPCVAVSSKSNDYGDMYLSCMRLQNGSMINGRKKNAPSFHPRLLFPARNGCGVRIPTTTASPRSFPAFFDRYAHSCWRPIYANGARGTAHKCGRLGDMMRTALLECCPEERTNGGRPVGTLDCAQRDHFLRSSGGYWNHARRGRCAWCRFLGACGRAPR